MNIANIIEDGRLAGPQIRIAEVARLIVMEEKWIDYTVILPKMENREFKAKLDQYKIHFIEVPITRLSLQWKMLLKYILLFAYEILLLIVLLKKMKCEILHVSGGSWQIKGVIAGKIAGCKVLWHLNDTSIPKVIKIIFNFITLRGINGFIVAGKKVKDYYFTYSNTIRKKNIYEIQAPVDCSVFNPEGVDCKDIFPIKSDLNIVTVGNVNPNKGIEYFIKAAYLLKKRHEKINFHIIGPIFESQRKYIKKLYRLRAKYALNNLYFDGPSAKIPEILKAADIYLCSSVSEASPIAVWEAMAMELPVVATDVGDINRIITHGRNGFIVEPRKPEQMVSYIEKILSNPEMIISVGKNARETILNNLDIKIIKDKHIKAYREL